ncbi:hypothetical protein DFS34DRAFT_328877 [Phlyctochytrium arcticum]|nr:hypothetical protein DFS34DRAFT_328877 [Phlyctochytrium arcticum]
MSLQEAGPSLDCRSRHSQRQPATFSPTTIGLLALAAFSTIPLAAAQSCSPTPYSGTACSAVGVNYQVATPPTAISAAEEKLQQTFKSIEQLRTIAPACYGQLRQLYCSAAFPSCANGVTIFPCENTCKFAVEACAATFAILHTEDLLSDCTSMNVTGKTVPYPTTNCLGAAQPSSPLEVLPTQVTSRGTVAAPGEVFPEDGIPVEKLILSILFGLSFIAFLDLALTFSRMRRNYATVSWALTWIAIIIVVAVGNIKFKLNIARAFNTDFCRLQTLIMTYLAMSSYIWPFFMTLDAWYAVVKGRLRNASESTRWKWNAPFALLLPAIPLVIILLRANPVSLDAPSNVQPGFAPHIMYCTYLYPINTLAMSTIPFAFFFVIGATILGLHTAFALWKQRRAFLSATRSTGSSTDNVVGGTKVDRAQSRITAQLCLRVLGITALYILATVASNYQQVRALSVGRFAPEDSRPGFRDYVVAALGILGWIILCTSRATWINTTFGTLFLRCRGRSKPVFEDVTDDVSLNVRTTTLTKGAYRASAGPASPRGDLFYPPGKTSAGTSGSQKYYATSPAPRSPGETNPYVHSHSLPHGAMSPRAYGNEGYFPSENRSYDRPAYNELRQQAAALSRSPPEQTYPPQDVAYGSPDATSSGRYYQEEPRYYPQAGSSSSRPRIHRGDMAVTTIHPTTATAVAVTNQVYSPPPQAPPPRSPLPHVGNTSRYAPAPAKSYNPNYTYAAKSPGRYTLNQNILDTPESSFDVADYASSALSRAPTVTDKTPAHSKYEAKQIENGWRDPNGW